MGNKILSDTFGESTSEIYDLAADYLIMARNSNYEQSIQRYLAEHPSWSYEQATEQALIDAVVQIVGAGVEGAISGRISSLIENKTKKH
jgi:NAD(P)H-hydrate repair Nnr-like enzyme with NAD(P)H-hydrate epimerase domain